MYNERRHILYLNICALNISPSCFNALVVRMKSKVVNAAACSIPVEKFGVPKTMYITKNAVNRLSPFSRIYKCSSSFISF